MLFPLNRNNRIDCENISGFFEIFTRDFFRNFYNEFNRKLSLLFEFLLIDITYMLKYFYFLS